MRRKSKSKENSLIRSDPNKIQWNPIRSNPNCSNQVRIRSEPNRVGLGSDRIRTPLMHMPSYAYATADKWLSIIVPDTES